MELSPSPNSPRRWLPSRWMLAALAAAALAGLILGFALGGGSTGGDGPPGTAESTTTRAEVWTCSMHPQIRQPGFGRCPLCGMDLIPVTSDDDEDDAERPVYRVSEATRALMRIQTSPVERRFVPAEVRMVGKVDYDETRLAYITAWVPGRIDRLYVDFTGIQVRKGDHMVYLYSPELIVAQEELRRAARSLEGIRAGAPEVLRETAQSTIEAARSKLRRWGLTDTQIRQAETTGALSDHITIYAPTGGTVIERSGQEGMYVDTGTRIYTIADLSAVWVRLDAYESDLAWLHYGQPVVFTAEAYPGATFEGKISFIEPILNPDTRTVKVRVNVPNRDGRLKPGMFVRAVVRAQIAAGGRVMDPGLAGKWISPMHPEIVKDKPGSCDVCGMALVRAEELGYVSPDAAAADKPLVIPASAPLITGTRAVVYVERPGTDRPTFEGRQVVLGPRAGDYYLVEEGLEEGEQVVTNGNFKIDSALQILAKPSMMSPPDHAPPKAPAADLPPPDGSMVPDGPQAPPEFQAQLRAVVEAYIVITQVLANDEFEGAVRQAAVVAERLEAVEMALVEGESHDTWMSAHAGMKQALDTLGAAGDIKAARQALDPLSSWLIGSVKRFGLTPGAPVFEHLCPMAFGETPAEWRAGHWLQANDQLRNPYWGSGMLECGEVLGRLDPADGAPADHEGHAHE